MATAPFRMESKGLADGLWAVARATATAYEVRFAPNCEQLTEAFVRGRNEGNGDAVGVRSTQVGSSLPETSEAR
jgi:hypothetical protein